MPSRNQRQEPTVSAFHSNALTTVALGIASFLIYLITVGPTVGGGDSGELITAAYLGGVAHPPGYPLYTLLARIFMWLPVGSIAYRVNLLSASCGSATVVVMALIALRVSKNVPAAIFTAALFAFSPTVWTYATTAEVFALNNFLLALFFFLVLAYERSPSQENAKRTAVGIAFLMGLGLSNHFTFALFAGPIGLVLFWRDRKFLLYRRFPVALALALGAGLLPYLYLVWDGHSTAAYSWGDTRSFSGFLRHVTRAEYGTLRLASPSAQAGAPITSSQTVSIGWTDWSWMVTRRLAVESLFLGIGLAAFGIIEGFRDLALRRWAIFSLGLILAYHTLFTFSANVSPSLPIGQAILSRFTQAPNLLLFLWAGFGFAQGVRRLRQLFPKGIRWLPYPIALGFAAAQVLVNFHAQDHRGDWKILNLGRAYLEELPPQSLLLVDGDLAIHATMYARYVEGIRPDVRVVSLAMLSYAWMKDHLAKQAPEITIPGNRLALPELGGYTLGNFLDTNLDKFPIVVSYQPTERWGAWENRYQTVPVALGMRFLPKSMPLETIYPAPPLSTGQKVSAESLTGPVPDVWEREAKNLFWNEQLWAGEFSLRIALAKGRDESWLRETVRLLEPLLPMQIEPDEPRLLSYKILGIAYTELSSREASLIPKAVGVWKKFLPLAPANDPDLGEIRAFLQAHQ